MTRCWVIDTSPLILLSKIGQVELLHELSDEMVIPAGVAQEILQGAKNDVARRWLEHQGKNWVQDIGKIHSTISVWGLGLGESEVFSYIKTHPNYIAIVDDRAARNCACTLKIKVRGTLGVLLLAKKMGKIAQLKPLLIKLQHVGLRINSRLIDEALKLSGEQD
jgi:predicted nucleic acid-binding protein